MSRFPSFPSSSRLNVFTRFNAFCWRLHIQSRVHLSGHPCIFPKPPASGGCTRSSKKKQGRKRPSFTLSLLFLLHIQLVQERTAAVNMQTFNQIKKDFFVSFIPWWPCTLVRPRQSSNLEKKYEQGRKVNGTRIFICTVFSLFYFSMTLLLPFLWHLRTFCSSVLYHL